MAVDYKQQLNGIRNEWIRFKLLLRHFVIRLFNNDVLRFEDQKREAMIGFVTILAVFGMVMAAVRLYPYFRGMPGYTLETAWREKTFFFFLSMVLTGIMAVINWDNIFMDDTDHAVLSSLPVSRNTLFAAKFFSLLFYVGIITAAFNLLALFVFIAFLGGIPARFSFMEFNVLRFTVVHLVSVFMANLFIFLVTALIQGGIMLVFRGRWLRKISTLVQGGLLFAFLSLLVLIHPFYPMLAKWKETYSAVMYYLPTLWFVGFGEYMLGNSDYIFRQLFIIACVSLTLVLDLYVLSFPINFKRRVSHASPGSGGAIVKPKRTGVGAVLKNGFDKWGLPHPFQRAMFYFSIEAFSRSRKHKLYLMIFLALPLSFIFMELVLKYMRGSAGYFSAPAPFTLSIPFIYYIFLVAGMRFTVLHPVSLKSNWLFRLTENGGREHILKGFKNVCYIFGFLPFFLFLLGYYWLSWGFKVAVLHSVFGLVSAYATLEAAFFSYRKMPFAGVYVPGKARLKTLWPLYLIGYTAYASIFTALGSLFLREPVYYLYFYALLLAGVLLGKWLQRRKYRGAGFVFDEEPEQEMLTLGFD